LNADTSARKEIRRVGKYHVELERELWQQLERIAMKQVKGVVGRAVVGL